MHKQILLIVCLLFTVGCSSKPIEHPSPTISAFNLYVAGLVAAAETSEKIKPETNCFQEAKVEPQIIKAMTGPDVVDALLGGSADFGTIAVTPVVFQILQERNLQIFATIQTTDKDIKVLGHKDAGIESGKSLKGKRLGYVGGTSGEIFRDRYLKKHEVQKEDVELISARPAQLRDLFIKKELDAIILWEPFVQDIVKKVSKEELFIDIDPTIYTVRMNLVAKKETLEQKKEEAEKILEALLCAEKLIEQYPTRSRHAVELWLGRKENALENVFDPKTFQLTLNIDALKEELKEEAMWAKEAIFDGKPSIPEDTSLYVNATIMQAVAPERIHTEL